MDPHINPETGVWDDNYYANVGKYKNGGGGGGANLQAYDDVLKSMPKATDMVTSLNTNENNAFGEYLDYLKSQDTPLQFYTKISEASGIPQMRQTQKTLQGQIYDLEDTLRRIEPDVSATTRNSVVTEAQRRGMVMERQKPVIENLGWLGQSHARISGAITESNQQAIMLTDLNQKGTQQFIDAYKTKLDMAIQQGSRALQAFMHDADNVLNVSLAKIHRGEQVSDQEAQNAFELLKMQKQAEYNMKAEEAKINTEVIEAGGRKLLIDKKTGKTIADLGSSKAPGSDSSNIIASYYDDEGYYGGGGGSSDWEIVPTNILDYNRKYFM